MLFKTLLASIFYLATTPLLAQQTVDSTKVSKLNDSSSVLWHPKPARDQTALKIIERAQSAMGGDAYFGAISTLEVTGTTDQDSKGHFVWQTSGTEYRLHSSNGAYEFEVNSGSGRPFRSDGGVPSALNTQASSAAFVPAAVGQILHRVIEDQGYDVRSVGPSTLDATQVQIVTISSTSSYLINKSSFQTWYFDESSGLPIRISYYLFDSNRMQAHTDAFVDLAAYETFHGGLYPTLISTSFNGKVRQTALVTSVEINKPIASVAFSAVLK